MSDAAPLLLGPGLTARRVRVARGDVAWLRYVLEAQDGLANLHGDADGVITLVTTDGLAEELDRALADLADEIDLAPMEWAPAGGAPPRGARATRSEPGGAEAGASLAVGGAGRDEREP